MWIRNSQDLGALIRDRRRRLGLNQQALAERLGASRLWISQVERGKPRAELGLALSTLEVLGVELHVPRGDPTGERADPLPDIDEVVARALRP